jgi:hypothetical protein
MPAADPAVAAPPKPAAGKFAALRAKYRDAFFRVVTLAVVILIIVGAVLSLRALHNDHSAVAYGGCAKAPAANQISTPTATGPGAATPPAATLKVGQSTTLAFGRTTQAKHLILYLTLTKALPAGTKNLQVRVDPFRRNDDARLSSSFDSAGPSPTTDDIQATATPSGRELRLDVCFGRQGNHLGNPGTYTGSVAITDPRLASEVSVPMTVTMQYIHGTILLWLVFFALVPGTWLLWITNRKKADDAPVLSRDWWDWFKTTSGLIAAVTGTVAAVSVYIATYLKDPTWGSSPYQAITLYGAMFSAFVATSGIAHAGTARTETPTNPPEAEAA